MQNSFPLMKLIAGFASSIILSLFSTSLFSQQSLWITPRDSTEILEFCNRIQSLETISLERIDTTTSGIHEYDPFKKGFYLGLGNIGQPVKSLLPEFKPNKGFQFGRDAMDVYRFTPQNLPFYQSSSVFSEVRYVMGPDKENNIHAKFNRNLYRGLNIGLNYRLIHSTGPYTRQLTDLDNIGVDVRYFSPSKHYGVMAQFIRNVFDFQQNGGIQNENEFEQNRESRRPVIPVKLSSARTKEIGNVYTITQFYEPHWGRAVKIPAQPSVYDSLMMRIDTLHLPNDSSGQNPDIIAQAGENQSRLFTLGRFSHTFSYSKDAYAYSDDSPKSGFYPEILKDSTKTYDSITIYRIENELSWTNSLYLYPTKFPIKLRLALRYLIAGYHFDSLEIKNFHQWIPTVDLRIDFPAGIRLQGNAFYVNGDYNGGDLGIEGSLSKFFGKKPLWSLAAEASFSSSHPDYFYVSYRGNHQQWENNFQREEILRLGGSISGPHTLVKPEFILLNNLVYLAKTAKPMQRNGSFSLWRLYLKQGLRLRHFHMDATVVLHKLSDTLSLRLPSIMAKGSLSYVGYMFKDALFIEPGISASWYSKFYADAYMPSLNAFYLQSEKQIGNYFVADIFLNLKVARARLFLRYRHFHSAWTGYNYWGAPGYPLPDAGINFGVIWPFYD
ncbi:MAG: hypothetical protein KBF06_07395 [Bacteroidales bacterium]|mgnify:CR=1 FL=1|nr:hypothetical protein [Bacteroidales bacterium]MDI9573763.1 hypothetical protein [Bacteroidota bacterium]OQC56776.1 MAG: hypothetical protein BWX51_02079 [Bacteroidetes bacterium ADurb.Bin012]MBP9512294.1 hypothetical protein [Bacteroidales bacterium]MBP9589375.1 hypothetical protein [Bacteroidales bacterium]